MGWGNAQNRVSRHGVAAGCRVICEVGVGHGCCFSAAKIQKKLMVFEKTLAEWKKVCNFAAV